MKSSKRDRVPSAEIELGAVAWAIIVLAVVVAGRFWYREATLPPQLSIYPSDILQGDPVLITVSGTTTTANIASASVDATSSPADPELHFFPYKNAIAAVYGVDLGQKPGTIHAVVKFKGGSELDGSFQVSKRAAPAEFLAIPASLGGNSVANQESFVSVLADDNYRLAQVKSSATRQFWEGPFVFPVASTGANPLVVTDPYGYLRDSGAATIVHKGVDFRAPPGTPVYAINRGVVRQATYYTSYGNTVIIDHGDGILSMYMHLSKIDVSAGQLVSADQEIGESGETGYSEGPHLHLTIRVGGVSIDPIKFLALFGTK